MTNPKEKVFEEKYCWVQTLGMVGNSGEKGGRHGYEYCREVLGYEPEERLLDLTAKGHVNHLQK